MLERSSVEPPTKGAIHDRQCDSAIYWARLPGYFAHGTGCQPARCSRSPNQYSRSLIDAHGGGGLRTGIGPQGPASGGVTSLVARGWAVSISTARNGELRVAWDALRLAGFGRSRKEQTDAEKDARASSVTRARGCRADGGVRLSPPVSVFVPEMFQISGTSLTAFSRARLSASEAPSWLGRMWRHLCAGC